MPEPVRYHIDLSHRRQHLVTVRTVVPADCARGAIVQLPCWTPGSYLRRDYIRHLQQIDAHDRDDTPVALAPIGGDAWQIPHDVTGPVTVRIELFANDLSVRTNMVDADIGLIIPAATCLAVHGATGREQHVTIRPTEPSHSVYSLLKTHPDLPDTFVADNYDHLIDAAFTAGTHTTVALDIDTVPHLFVWAGPGDMFDPDVVIKSLPALARACADVFDTPLVTELYTVLMVTGPTGSGGLEHRDGAVLHVPETTFTKPESIARFQSLLAHEYLHAWNVKRLIPQTLTTLRYDEVVRTTSLWLAEGFTAYYDGVLCVRAKLWDTDRLLARFSRNYTDLTRTPGVVRQSLADASWRAPERQYRRDENATNAMTEYYTHGSLVALELDALLRGENSAGDGLDDLMRLMWQRHRHTGYTDDDVFTAVADLAGDTIAHRLTQRVTTAGLADSHEFADALHALSLTLTSDPTKAGWLGVQLAATPPTTGVRLAATLRDGPAWRAGLTGNDVVLAVNDTVVTHHTFLDHVTQLHPGDTAVVQVLRHNRIDALPVTVALAPPSFTITHDPNATATEQVAFTRWLGVSP